MQHTKKSNSISKKRFLIGVQARSTSTRLPNKVLLTVGKKNILQHVIDACTGAADFINRTVPQAECRVVLLTPENDPINSMFKGKIDIVEGSELDVLSRYVKASEKYQADYVVRITSDCIRIPSHVISRHIKTCIMHGKAYTTNVLLRTFPEGYDTEVISKEALIWLDEKCTEPQHREHVTSYIAEAPWDFPFKITTVFDSPPNLSHIKTSIDTLEEYQALLKEESDFDALRKKAVQYGDFS